jgi:hypothetical protein
MTRDEHRKACIEAMTRAIAERYAGTEAHLAAFEDSVRADAITAFDALHGLARVCPIESTAEMIAALPRGELDLLTDIFDCMAASGRLTNPPEEKP